MFKIAYCAGHYIGTAGKRVPKSLDANQTREWTLNNRIARYFAEAAKQYEGVDLLRTDDATGKTHISIKNRTKKANEWGADFYLDIHHNAGILLGKGGGVVAFSEKKNATGKKYRDAIYSAVIEAGKLKGNRANPLVEKNYDSLIYSNAPGVLVEYGFMDSKTDAPIILTDAYAKKVGYATMEGVAKVAGLKKKASVTTQEAVEKDEQIYRVRTSWDNANSQKGAYKSLENAKEACSVGYTVYDKDGKAVFTNAYKVDGADKFSASKAGTYIATTTINLRCGASTKKQVIETIAKGKAFTCYGYYTGEWLYGVSPSGKKGFCHKSNLKKK